MQGRILAIWLGLMSACYSPAQPDCGFACKRSGECPSEYFCAPDGVCHRNGTSPTAPCAIDARVDSPRPIDAPPADADTTPPSVFATSPVDGAVAVPTNSVISVEFNEPVSVTGAGFQVFAGAGQLTGALNASDPLNWTFTPTAALPTATTISVQLSAAITDLSGNALVPVTFSFTTAL